MGQENGRAGASGGDGTDMRAAKTLQGSEDFYVNFLRMRGSKSRAPPDFPGKPRGIKPWRPPLIRYPGGASPLYQGINHIDR
jgi:hypothetical protein